MVKTKPLTSALPLVAAICAVPATQQPEPCDDFYERLEAVPHVSLSRTSGTFPSIWGGESLQGCEIAFETTDSVRNGTPVPDFMADPGTDLFREGWRMIPEIVADGAGSGVHGIRRGPVRCLVRWEQAAYIDDDGSFVESETLTMRVQCAGSGPS